MESLKPCLSILSLERGAGGCETPPSDRNLLWRKKDLFQKTLFSYLKNVEYQIQLEPVQLIFRTRDFLGDKIRGVE